MRLIAKTLFMAAGAAIALPAAAQNLVKNGSFESPVQNFGGYTDYAVGSSGITDWDIIGVSGTYVSVVDENYGGNPGFSFPANLGSQWLDLAGYYDNAPNGVQQTVATVINATYVFSFYVGNVSGGPNNPFGTQSSVGVGFSSGGTSFTCTNDTPGSTLLWKLCSQQFVATSTMTTFTLSNLDPSNDFSNAVDNVSLVQVETGVPEPATWAMMLLGFGLVGGVLRKRPAPSVRWRLA